MTPWIGFGFRCRNPPGHPPERPRASNPHRRRPRSSSPEPMSTSTYLPSDCQANCQILMPTLTTPTMSLFPSRGNRFPRLSSVSPAKWRIFRAAMLTERKHKLRADDAVQLPVALAVHRLQEAAAMRGLVICATFVRSDVLKGAGKSPCSRSAYYLSAGLLLPPGSMVESIWKLFAIRPWRLRANCSPGSGSGIFRLYEAVADGEWELGSILKSVALILLAIHTTLN